MFEVTCYDYTGEEIDFLVQWDTGVTIEIRDIELPETPIIHFSNKYSDKSLALRDGVVYENKTLIAPIPDELLQEPYMLTVYIYAHEYDKNRGKTTNIAKLPIMAKPKPDGYVAKQSYEGINILALKVNVDKNTEDISNLKIHDDLLDKGISALQGRATSLEERALKTENAIDVLNGTEEGSVDYKINKAFNEFVDDTSNDDVVNTYKELIDYAAEHASEVVEITKNISDNAKSISDLKDYVGLIPEESSATNIVLYTDEQVSAESDRATKAEISLDARLFTAEASINTMDTRIATAKSEAIAKSAEDATSKANAAEKNAKDYADISFVTPAALSSTLGNYNTINQSNSAYAAKALEHTHENQDVLNDITSDQVASWNALAGGDSSALFTSIFNSIYPVGSIYMSTLSTDPSTIFGGTWASWGNGRVPVGVDSSQTEFATAEKTGGEKSHALTAAEMPSHTHTGPSHSHTMGHTHDISAHSHSISAHTHGIPRLSGTTADSGSHQHYLTYSQDMKVTAGTDNRVVANGTGEITPGKYGTVANVANQNGDGTHSHTFSTPASTTDPAGNTTTSGTSLSTGDSSNANTGSAGTGNTGSAGSGSAHNILQPYITCYMWKRLTLA